MNREDPFVIIRGDERTRQIISRRELETSLRKASEWEKSYCPLRARKELAIAALRKYTRSTPGVSPLPDPLDLPQVDLEHLGVHPGVGPSLLAKTVQLCGRAEDQGTIDDEDVKQLIKALDDAALPTSVREENGSFQRTSEEKLRTRRIVSVADRFRRSATRPTPGGDGSRSTSTDAPTQQAPRSHSDLPSGLGVAPSYAEKPHNGTKRPLYRSYGRPETGPEPRGASE